MQIARLYIAVTLLLTAGAAAAETNFGTLYNYGRYANAAYGGPAQIDGIARATGYQVEHMGTDAQTGVGYFLATNEARRHQIIAVRGTANAQNAVTDLDFKLRRDTYADTDVHQGFSVAAQNVYDQIRTKFRRDFTINTTGHSLGGAVALVLAMYLQHDGYTVGEIVTFGQPKVSTRPAAEHFGKLNLTRVVTPDDMVPLVPPFDPSDIANLNVAIYWHLGKEVILFPGRTYSVLQGLDSMLRGLTALEKPPSEQNLASHTMDEYLALIRQKGKEPVRIPFDQRAAHLDKYPAPSPL
ncbi:MAG: lipase family protein [Pseudomonadota bacterium]|nr:MAG: lipase family protein [Pseudomonadota bacterium]